MDFVDMALMAVMIIGAVYLLYRSIWGKKGHCPGCNHATCVGRVLNGSDDRTRR